MPSLVRAITRIRDADDAPALGAGQNGYALTWNNATSAFVATALSGATPGGSDTYVQFNDGSAFGGDAGLVYNKTTDVLTGLGRLVMPKWSPASDSTTALQITKADGSTPVATINTTSSKLVLAGTLDVVAGTVAGASAGHVMLSTTNGSPAYIGVQGGSWHVLGLWAVGKSPTSVPSIGIDLTNSISISGPFKEYSTSIRFEPRGDIGANPGVLITSGGTGVKTLAIRAFAAQTANLQEWQNSSSVALSSVGPGGNLDLVASTTTAASLRIRTGVAPTSPSDGDIWFDNTSLFIRIGGVTKTVTVT